VRAVVSPAQDVVLDVSLTMLFVDGLHDYSSVSGDITQLQRALVDGGLLACHDYGTGYWGVTRAVDMLRATGAYELLDRAESLVVLRKVDDLSVPPLHAVVEAAMTVDGWYERDELTELAWTAAAVLSGQASGKRRPGDLVEIGGHHGRATAVLAGIVGPVTDGPRVHVVDRFDGLLGGIGEAVWQGEPTRDAFSGTLSRLGLTDRVRVSTREAGPEGPPDDVGLLLVNGLHDYGSAAQDLRDFEHRLTPDAVVAFPNYGSHWPGVRALVDERVARGEYTWRALVGSLAVLDRAAPVPAAAGASPATSRRGRKVAVVTTVADEAFFLPIWLRYYGQFVGPEDLYVLDHDSSDGSTDGPGFVRVPIHNPVTDWAWLRDVVQAQQHELLTRYDAVLCTDVDEIVIPDPAYGDLASYFDEFDTDFVTCRGWEVLHDPEGEAPLKADAPILAQRRWWFRHPIYDKPLLARVPMRWVGGFHARTDGEVNDDPRLFLVHLHRVDRDRCLERHRQRVARPWVPEQAAAGWGYQERIVDSDSFDAWFATDASGSGRPVERQAIPERWRAF
jgi:hypothetical protein